MLEVGDVKRAGARGLVAGLVNAGAAALLAPLLGELRWTERTAFTAILGVGLHPRRAALYGMAIGLLAAPLGLVEIARAKKSRALAPDLATAALVFALAAPLVGLVSLQAVYTGALMDGVETTAALAAVNEALRQDPSPAYGLVCVAAAAPLATIAFLRIRGVPLSSRILGGLATSMLFSIPLLASVAQSPVKDDAVHALLVWIFAGAIAHAPAVALADRIAGDFEAAPLPNDESPP